MHNYSCNNKTDVKNLNDNFLHSFIFYNLNGEIFYFSGKFLFIKVEMGTNSQQVGSNDTLLNQLLHL